jgi:hypothetical protein
VRVEGDRILVDRLLVQDPALAAFVAERPADDRPELVGRALRIGLLAIQDTAVTLNVDVVRAEFEKLMRQAESVNDKAAQALEQTLRANFADGDGRCRARSSVSWAIAAPCDRWSRNSSTDEARQRHRTDRDDARALLRRRRLQARVAPRPDASQLAAPPVPPGDDGRLQVNRGAARGDRGRRGGPGAERARSAAKGGDFEDLLEAMLADLARGAGDLLDRTGTETGAVLKSKKGDFVLTVDPRAARGADVRVVIEAKDRPMSMRAIRDELREARENRCAAGAVVVFTPAHAPTGIAPFSLVGDDVYCVIDPVDPSRDARAALRLARLLALTSLVEHEVEVDPAAIGAALTAIREQLEVVRTLKSQLTSISNATKAVWTGLDSMRATILARVAEAESEIGGRAGRARTTPDRSPTHIGTMVSLAKTVRRRTVGGCAVGSHPCSSPCSSPSRSSAPRTPRNLLHRRRPTSDGGATGPDDRARSDRVAGTDPGPDTTPTDAAQPGPTTDAGPAGDEPAPPTATAPARAPDARDRWIVLLKKGADTTRVIEKAGKRDGVKADHKFGRAVRGFSAQLDATQRKDLLADPNVAAVVPDGVVQVTARRCRRASPASVGWHPRSPRSTGRQRVRRRRRHRRHRASRRSPTSTSPAATTARPPTGRRGATRTRTARTSRAPSARSTTRSASSVSRRARACGASRSSTTTATA